jgi:hypothetical protein
MKKTAILIVALSLLPCLFLSTAYAGEIKLQLKDSSAPRRKDCYSLRIITTYNFDYNNVNPGFKLMDGNEPVTCRRIKTTVPKGLMGQ